MYYADLISTMQVAHVDEVPVRQYYLQISNPDMFSYSFCFGPFATKDLVPRTPKDIVYKIRYFIGYDIYTDDHLKINGVQLSEQELVDAGARRP